MKRSAGQLPAIGYRLSKLESTREPEGQRRLPLPPLRANPGQPAASDSGAGARFPLSFSASLRLCGEKCLRRLPPLTGAPIRIETLPGLRDRRGAVHAGSFLRQRRIAFDCSRTGIPADLHLMNCSISYGCAPAIHCASPGRYC